MRKGIIIIIFIAFSCLSLCFVSNKIILEESTEGKQLFEKHCRSCHLPTTSLTAPPFQKIRQFKGKEWVYEIVRNSPKFYKKDKRVTQLVSKFGSIMPLFPHLSNVEIDAICDYVDSFPFDKNSKEYNDRK